MSISMHQASAPVFIRMLTNLSAILDKTQAHADAKKFDSANYLGARLAPDMLPFTKQVQIACAEAKEIVIKLGPKQERILTFTGLSFLQGFAIGNLYFHVATAYALLRNMGVEVAKTDFLGAP